MSDPTPNAMPKTDYLGQILIKRGLITQEQLNEALEMQKQDKSFVGEALIKLGFVEERDVVVALVVQCNLPYIAVNKYNIDPQMLQILPAPVAQKYLAVPLDKVGKVLSVVMANPLDESAKAEIEQLTQCKVVPFIATKSEIKEAVERYYGKTS